MINNPLLDAVFLKQLFNQNLRELWVKIISLDFEENPLEEIQGKISSGGNINVDGSSAVRRTCSLTMVTQNTSITEYYWALESKFKLEVGLTNSVDAKYPNIIWFKQGTYVITSFSQSLSTNGNNISISGKDKMCLLNGEVGGNFTASTELATIKTYDNNGNIVVEEDLTLKEIIYNIVHIFGKEPARNIIINDLDDEAVELLKYVGNSPIYYLRNMNGEVVDVIVDPTYEVWLGRQKIAIGQLSNYYSLSPFIDNQKADKIKKSFNDEESYYVIQMVYGQSAGYRKTAMTYPGGSLEAKAAATITSVLDTIVKKFVDYEYFYDIYGRFVFQKKRTYLNTSWSPIDNHQLMVNLLSENTETVWRFDNSELITAFNNTPNLLNLKNDFTVWGERVSASGQKLPIHTRYAIDTKPTIYTTTGLEEGETSTTYSIDKYDWRELIFQMAKDYYNNNQKGALFYQELMKKNKFVKNGKTGYEQYYVDLLGFWRDIYLENGSWNEAALADPETMNFWFDFVEGESVFAKQSVSNIGDRTKVVNDSASTAISFRDTIDVLYVKQIPEIKQDGFTYIQLPTEYEALFVINESQKSTKNELDNLLYNYSYCAETASITAIPVYHLEPNTKIVVSDNNNNLQGQYIINKISYSLQQNGTMSLNVIKDIDRIY